MDDHIYVNNIKGPFISSDYNTFKFDPLNRDIDERHVQKLKTDFVKDYIDNPIKVNEKMYIMDGQHSFLALKELGMPIIYNIHVGMRIEDVPLLNNNQKSWSWKHYMDFYAKKEKRTNRHDYAVQPYNLYQSFYKQYPYPIQILMDLLSGVNFGSSPLKVFKQGEIKIKSFSDAKRKIKLIEEMKPLTDEYNNRSFVLAFINALEHHQFSIKRWMEQLSKYRADLFHCRNASQYMERIQYIYNYRKGDKLIFSFKQKANGAFVKLAS